MDHALSCAQTILADIKNGLFTDSSRNKAGLVIIKYKGKS
jgi:hypothetical protein